MTQRSLSHGTVGLEGRSAYVLVWIPLLGACAWDWSESAIEINPLALHRGRILADEIYPRRNYCWLRSRLSTCLISFPSLVEHMIQKNHCLFTSTQCKVCCAMLISESQKLAHYQVGHFYCIHAFTFQVPCHTLLFLPCMVKAFVLPQLPDASFMHVCLGLEIDLISMTHRSHPNQGHYV